MSLDPQRIEKIINEIGLHDALDPVVEQFLLWLEEASNSIEITDSYPNKDQADVVRAVRRLTDFEFFGSRFQKIRLDRIYPDYPTNNQRIEKERIETLQERRKKKKNKKSKKLRKIKRINSKNK